MYDKRQIITSCNLTLLEFGSTACICYAGGIKNIVHMLLEN
ncbi:hypothetical protein D3OALGA1CA_5558 [Olavius algarvensis associated proteobacterium Delta 3]|nr:hypothetical protein D3OALGB2SA_5114 [Olavius algarvensis associated proteobacterium Delta 3]CAB5168482.1 hypothetical protein D3OALGA1CA_5558 [Olavius algarvensis associated proteobacterium Delta 3]